MFLSLFHLIISHTFFMGSYSNEVFPDPLSKEEEEEYIKKMKEGDSEARNQLILHNLNEYLIYSSFFFLFFVVTSFYSFL